MHLTAQDARLALILMGKSGVDSAIRCGEFTAADALRLQNALRAFAQSGK